jgi:uncharacterized repeat protein (TIGR02543 family)
VSLPSTLESIGERAFYGCTGLEAIWVGASVTEIGEQVFEGCAKLVITAPEYSYAIQYAIDHGIAFICDGSNEGILVNSAVDRENSYYMCDSNFVQSNGYLTFRLNIDVKEEFEGRLSNTKIVIKIPSNASLQPQSLYLNHRLATSDEFSVDDETNKIIIPTDGTTTLVTFNLIPASAGIISTYAQYEYNLNAKTHSDTIGIVNELIPILTISAPREVSTGTISINGTTFSNTEVSIYLDDVFVKTLTAKKTGRYSGDITIDDPQDGAAYTVKAVAEVNGSTVNAECIVEYSKTATVLTEFKMYLEGTTYDLLALKDKQPLISLTSTENPWVFTIRFNDATLLKNIVVCSTKSGVKKYIDAVWDAARQQYVANGFFDENNHQYLPGVLTVEYTKQLQEPSLEDSTPDFSDPAKIPEEVKDLVQDPDRFQVEEKTNTDTEYEAHITITDDESGVTHEIDYKQLPIPSDLTEANIESQGYTKVTDSSGYTVYHKPVVTSSARPGVSGADAFLSSNQIISRVESQTVDFYKGVLIDFGAELFGNTFGGVASIFTLGKMATQDNQEYDRWNRNLDSYITSVKNSGLSDREKEGRYASASYARGLKTFSAYLSCVGVTLSGAAALGLIAGPHVFVAGLVVAASSYLLNLFAEGIMGALGWADRIAGNAGTQFRWNIDPSGYAYEAVTGNRISGVKVTAWWYPPEDEPDAAREWDASEYEQDNPLYTDSQGRYAWNVPEGTWQVRFEKDGYEDAQSEWLPVPPPQLDVNVSMVSLDAPAVSFFNAYEDFAEVEFTKYLNPQTAAGLILKNSSGNEITYSLEYPTGETAADGTVYAKYYRLVFDDTSLATDEDVTLAIPSDVQSYAGIPAAESTLVGSVANQMSLEVPESVTVDMNQTKTIEVKINGYDEGEGLSVTAVSGHSDTVRIDEIGDIQEDGTFSLRLTGNLPGSTTVDLSIDGKNLSAKIPVTVELGDVSVMPQNHLISFDANGGSVDIDSLSVTYNATVGILPIPVRVGHTFEGWFTAASDGIEYDENTVYTTNGDISLFARWQINSYTVTFDANDNFNLPTNTTKTYNEELGSLSELTRVGYSFDGWYTAPSGGMQVSPATKVTGDVTYWAHWTAVVVPPTLTYTVIFFDFDSTVIATQIVAEGTAATAPADPVREGYTFAGWDKAFSNVTANLTIMATYTALPPTPTYTVTFAPGEHGAFVAQVTPGLHAGDTTPEAPQTDAEAGWRFVDWQPVPAATVTGDATYTAQWERVPHTVSYIAGAHGSGLMPDVTVNAGSSHIVAQCDFTPQIGYTFVGWDASGAANGGYNPGDPLTITGDVTLTARWEPIVVPPVPTYTVTFAPGEHGAFVAQVTPELHAGDVTPTAPQVTAETGWRFVDWQPAPTATVTGDVTYTAQWEQIVYKVTFDPTGGSAVEPREVVGGAALGGLPVSARAGYDFAGWFTSAEGGTAVTAATVVTDDVTYFAHWTHLPAVVAQHEGGNRQETAVRASVKAYPDPSLVDSVILAYSYNFPDALAASYLAGALNAPILLTDTSSLDEATALELARLRPSSVYIVGGIGSISENVERTLNAYDFTSGVIRLGGAGREETAYLIANEAKTRGGAPTTAFIADAANFPDALSAGSLSAAQGVPILLTATGSLDGWAQRFLTENGISDIIIVGGPGSVSEGVAGQLRALSHAPAVVRWSGSDRYATSKAVLDNAIAKWGISPSVVGLASGDGFPDALVGGAAVGNRGGLLAITDPDALSDGAIAAISDHKDILTDVEIFGGTGTIRVADEVQGLLA